MGVEESADGVRPLHLGMVFPGRIDEGTTEVYGQRTPPSITHHAGMTRPLSSRLLNIGLHPALVRWPRSVPDLEERLRGYLRAGS